MMRMRTLILAGGLIWMALTAGLVAAQRDGERGFLGVQLEDSADGVVIAQVVEGSPAAAGLQAGDIITAINGEAVSTAADVAAIVRGTTPGETITLTITRDGESQDVEVELGSAPPAAREPEPLPGGGRGGSGDHPPFASLLTTIIYNPAREVWEVRMISEDTALYAAGLRQGDVVTAFNGEVEDMLALRELVETSAADALVTLTVERDGAEQEIEVPAAALTEFYAPMNVEGFEPLDPSVIIPGYMLPTNGRLGVTFVTLTEESAAENAVEFMEGALIQAVDADSPAEQAGVQVGDIVTAVNGEPVDQERTLRDRIYAYEPGDVVTLTITREGESLEIEVTLGEQVNGMFMMPGMVLPEGRFHMMPPAPLLTPEPGLQPDATAVPNT